MAKMSSSRAPAVEDYALVLLSPRQRTVTYGARPLAAIVAFVPIVANASLIASSIEKTDGKEGRTNTWSSDNPF